MSFWKMSLLKKLTTLTLTILLSGSIFGQNLEECRQIVNLTIESLNTKSTESLKEKLSEDFSIAGQKGEIARMVVTQLFSQLNDEVTSFRESSQKRKDYSLTLKYDVDYKGRGRTEATFIFNADNLLTELELFSMEVKTMNSQTEVQQPESKVIEIPFSMAGKLISVPVKLDGQEKNFLLDSGSPKTILNSNHLENQSEHKTISASKGIGGNISGMNIQNVEHLEFSGITLQNQDVLTMNLKHLEEELETEIYGLIGYDLIKDYDILFDYDARKITLISTGFYESYLDTNLPSTNLVRIPLQMKGHIPVVECQINTKTLSFGIDCGAESNLIDDDLFISFKKQLKKIGTDSLSGADGTSLLVKKALVKNLHIGDTEFKNMPTLFSDISHLNKGYNMNLDGLVGFEVLSRQKTLISYKRAEMVFID